MTFFNNWRQEEEFIIIEISQKVVDGFNSLIFCILGFGVVFIIKN